MQAKSASTIGTASMVCSGMNVSFQLPMAEKIESCFFELKYPSVIFLIKKLNKQCMRAAFHKTARTIVAS